MCSIFGFNQVNGLLLQSFFKSMHHRGPDDDGYVMAGDWTLGQQRLAIIDLSIKANQPMQKGDNIICLNGEIYNYLELKRKYLSHVKLSTTSDTEVLLELLARKGIKILNKLNGMFSVAWYNQKTRKLYLIRDRFGVKPLYYLKLGNKFYFSSETKPLMSLLPKVVLNPKLIDSYLKDTASDYCEETFIKRIKQIMPGTYLCLKGAHQLTKATWYHYSDYHFDKSIFQDKVATLEIFEDLLTDSIRIRYRADVPICITLSSGLDSTAIYTLTKERINSSVQAITYINQDSKINEFLIAKRLTTDYRDKLLTIKNKPKYTANDLITNLRHLEFPIWNPSSLAYEALYRAISRKGFRVVIEGHGSDEQLGGYPYMIEAVWKELAQKGKFTDSYKAYRTYLKTLNLGIGENQIKIPFILLFLKTYLTSYISAHIRAENIIQQSFTYKILPMVLRAFDRLSMSQSLESRAPFMDYRLVEFLRAMPIEFKVDELGSKAPLRHILKKYHKEYIYKNTQKTGFAIDLPKVSKQPSILALVNQVLRTTNLPQYSSEITKAIGVFSNSNSSWGQLSESWKIASISMTKQIYDKI